MKYFIYLILLILLLALNIEAARLFDSWPVRLNWLLLPGVFAALEKKNDFLFLAFFAGLFLDFYNAAPFGSFLFSFLLVSAFFNWVARTFWVYELNWRLVALFVVLSYILAETLVFVFALWLPKGQLVNFSFSASQIWPQIIYGGMLHLLSSPLVYGLWRFSLKLIAKAETKGLALK